MKEKSPNRSGLLALAGFALYYVGLFILYPLQQSFIGNTDIIVHMALFYEHFQELLEFMSIRDFGDAFYPKPGIGAYMETYYGEALLFFIGRMFSGSDIWGSFFMYVSLYALNGWSVYLVTYGYTSNKWASFLAGIIFSGSCFMMSTLELLNGVSFFCIPFAIYFLERFFISKEYRHLMWSTIFLALTTFFSAYHFLMGSLVWLVLVATRYAIFTKLDLKKILISGIPSVLIALPLFLKVASPNISGSYNPMEGNDELYYGFSIHFQSFISSIPNNLIYPSIEESSPVLKTSYRTNLGLLCLSLFLVGIFQRSKRRFTYLIILVVATVISFGPYTFINGHKVPMPAAFLYYNDFLTTFFRMPGRAFVISNFIIALFCGIAFKWVLERINQNNWLILIIAIFIFTLENQAIPPFVNRHHDVIHAPEEYEAIKGIEKHSIIAEFPTSIFSNSEYKDGISEYTREFRYQYWKTQHHQNTLNGIASYYPEVKLQNNEWMTHITESNNLQELIEINKLDYIVFHKKLILQEKERGILPFFRNSTLLKEKIEGENMVVFKIVHGY